MRGAGIVTQSIKEQGMGLLLLDFCCCPFAIQSFGQLRVSDTVLGKRSQLRLFRKNPEVFYMEGFSEIA